MPGQISFSPVLPTSLTRAKKCAKQLQRFFPDSTLSKCQKTLAMLHGYKDWYALEQATSRSSNAGTYDDDLGEEALRLRRLEQAQTLFSEFSESELLSFCAKRPGWALRYTWLVVLELDSTRRQPRVLPDIVPARYSMIEHAEFVGMWAPLNDWAIHRNTPSLPPLPMTIWTLHIGARSPAALWLASGLIGCWIADNPSRIPGELAVGLSYVFADQYASLVSLLILAESEDEIDQEDDYFLESFFETRSDVMLSFFSCFALSDCEQTYAKSPRGMAKLAVDAINMLNLSAKLLLALD